MTVTIDGTVGANKAVVLDSAGKLPVIDGSQVTTLNATQVTTGTVAIARLDTGTTAGKVLLLDGSGNMPAVNASEMTGVASATKSTSSPTISTNPSTGLGTKWIKTGTGDVWILTDATAGANIWTNVGAGTGDVAPWAYQGESDSYMGGGARDSGLKITKFSFASNTTAALHGTFLTQRNEGSSPGLSSPTYGFALDNGTTGIEKFAFAGSSVTASTHGDLATRLDASSASNNETHGFIAGGYGTATQTDAINKFAFASNTTAADHGNLTLAKYAHTGQSSTTHGYATGGAIDGGPGDQNTIYKFAFASNTTATDIGNLTTVKKQTTGISSATHGYTSGGKDPNNYSTIVDKFPFASDTNAADVGDLTVGRTSSAGTSSTTHGFTINGDQSGGGFSNVIDKFSFSSDGNATDHGDGYWAAGTGNMYQSSHQV